MKKIISLLLIIFITSAAVCGVFAAEHKRGDVNGDGTVNNKDVVSLFRFVNGEEDAATEEYCDINGDGSINNKDVVALFKAVSAGDTPHIHTFGDETVTEEPTCTTPGKSIRTCTSCGYSEEKAVEALGHSWSAATCTSPKTCTRCKITSGTALGHAWDSGVVTTPPSTTSTGVKTYTCTRQGCGATYTETLPKLDGTCEHHWVRKKATKADIDAAATESDASFLAFCNGKNLAYYYCDVCKTIDTSRAEYYKSQYDACQEFLEYWNDLRASLGLTKVWYDEGWQEWAEIRAQKIVKQKFPNHDGARGFENLDTQAVSVYGVFNGWCNSPGHYACLVYPHYTDVYAGFAWGINVDRHLIGWILTGDDYRR